MVAGGPGFATGNRRVRGGNFFDESERAQLRHSEFCGGERIGFLKWWPRFLARL